MGNTALRIRRSITELQDEYTKGDKKALEDLMRAWKGIKDLPATDPHSFFMLGGFHGEPFRGAGWGSSSYWGGYCNHGNVLFPTWHRVYLYKLEEALQSIAGCEHVMLPFWDEISNDSLTNGIPWALTQETFPLDGQVIANPLRSFVFNRNIQDNINGDNPNYSKADGYETVRYPLSGLVGTDDDRAATAKHNALFPDYNQNVVYLNRNVTDWLTSHIIIDGKPLNPTSRTVEQKFKSCLDAPNYTVFSNTTSAAEWNSYLAKGVKTITPLESPHNDIHLSIGGFEIPTPPGAPPVDFSPIDGANGDMGENDTAGLDPIFYFHHCFIDRVFWLWQKKHGYTDHLEVIPGYPGTNSVDNQGPTPGVVPNSWLTLDTPLEPFQKKTGQTYISRDCINIEKQLGYTYGPGSLTQQAAMKAAALAVETGMSTRTVHVSGINRGAIRGSFLIAVFATIEGKKQLVGVESVLSRWSVQGCANCQTHLEAKASIGLFNIPEAALTDTEVDVEIHTRDGKITQPHVTPLAVFQKKAFRMEVR